MASTLPMSAAGVAQAPARADKIDCRPRRHVNGELGMNQQVIVRYRVTPERAAENEELVRAVYAELNETCPDGLRYATFKLDDGVSFVHLAEHDENVPNPLTQLAAFERFQANINDRCEEPPVVSQATPIGSYRLLPEPPTG
jgi:hypothetical protein